MTNILISATTKETIEIKFEVNCDSDKPEIVQIHESQDHSQLDYQQDQIVSKLDQRMEGQVPYMKQDFSIIEIEL